MHKKILYKNLVSY